MLKSSIVVLLFLVSLSFGKPVNPVLGTWLHPDQISTLVFRKNGELDYKRPHGTNIKGSWKVLDKGLMRIQYKMSNGTVVKILFLFVIKDFVCMDIYGLIGDPLIIPIQRIQLYREIKEEK